MGRNGPWLIRLRRGTQNWWEQILSGREFGRPTRCQMRFEVVINYYFYNAKVSFALKLKLPALLGILGTWQAWGDQRGAFHIQAHGAGPVGQSKVEVR